VIAEIPWVGLVPRFAPLFGANLGNTALSDYWVFHLQGTQVSVQKTDANLGHHAGFSGNRECQRLRLVLRHPKRLLRRDKLHRHAFHESF
jgi:hypothetical protein